MATMASGKSRKDGEATKMKILEAACFVFSNKGFREATVHEICKLAESNPALINYHFGDKASLYKAVWRHCAERAREYYPIEGGAGSLESVEDRLRAHIHTFVRCMADTGELSHLHRLNLLEMAAPNDFIRDFIVALRQPHTEYLRSLLREFFGDAATEEDIQLCEMSVIGQCRMARAGRGARSPDLTTPLSASETEQLADHIVHFTFSGLNAMRREILARSASSQTSQS